MSIRQTFNSEESDITARANHPALDPSTLFASSEQGFWYEADDINTLWQDTAQTIQVTSTGQTVNAWSDKSGNNLDLDDPANSTSGLPTYSGLCTYEEDEGGKKYINFDRANIEHDPGATTGWLGPGSGGLTVFLGVQPTSTTTGLGLIEIRERAFTYVTLRINHYSNSTYPGVRFHYDNIGENVDVYTDNPVITNQKSVVTVTWRYDQTNPMTTVRVNGVDVAAAEITGTNTNIPKFYQSDISLGRGSGQSFFLGRYYAAIGVDGIGLPRHKIIGIEKYIANKMGISILG